MPRILRGLQHLYVQLPIRTAIFKLLEERLLSAGVDKNNGRAEMTLWSIFVCGVIRLDLSLDYDRLHDLVNKYSDLRAMLGHVMFNDECYLSQYAKEVEKSEAFIKARHAHSAVESAMNALDVQGLDKYPDHGIEGFKRYVALAIVARNIHRIGTILWQQGQEQALRKRKRDERAPPLRQVA
jgi:hypothetical protein